MENSTKWFCKLTRLLSGSFKFFYSWMIAIPYSLFGRSVLMVQSISLLFGIGCIILGWEVKKIWDKKTAKKIAWTIALFPL